MLRTLFELKMINTKKLIKIVLGLGVWSFLIIGLMKFQGHLGFATVRQDVAAPVVNDQPTLENGSEDFETTTSATTKSIYPPDDVLVDDQPGK